MTAREDRLRAAYERAGQGHVFRFVDRLDAPARERFLDALETVDLPLLGRLVDELKHDRPVATLDLERLAPPPMVPVPEGPGGKRKENRAIKAGEELLREGKVAAFVVAGGQGSRLGFEGPKGCFPIGPVGGTTLFEWHFAKVKAASERYGARLPMLVMTSAANHEATVSFLEERAWFGLPQEDVFVFRQGMLPAVDPAGRLLLESEGSLFLSPDGHGGSLGALAREGLLDELERRGVEELFYFQVDNPLVKVLEPAFLGHHRLGKAEASSKAVPKRDASERVGVFAKAGRKLGIVEYSDLPDAFAAAREESGELAYRAGNVAIHVFRTDFVRRLTEGGLRLPYHRAKKAVRHVDPTADEPRPAEGTGVKFETFVFDALPEAKRSLVVETRREEEFSPVKNEAGRDSAATARRDMTRLFRGWLEAAGFEVAGGEDVRVEISPHLALDRDELVRRLKKERVLTGGRLLIE